MESVRESSVDKILEKFNYQDDLVIDSNGEIVDWLEGSESEPYLTTKFHGEGREKLKQAIIGLNGANEIPMPRLCGQCHGIGKTVDTNDVIHRCAACAGAGIG